MPHPQGGAHEMGDATHKVCTRCETPHLLGTECPRCTTTWPPLTAPPGVDRAAHNALHGRTGDWMQTVTGVQFYPLDPRPEDVNILDIAAALAKQCRFGGHCDWHYSVAQHSVYVSHQVEPEHQLAALMHDATEAYCVDVPRPLKRSLIGYDKVESRIWQAIATKFALPLRLHPSIHEADEAVLLAEKAQIMRPGPAWTMNTRAEPAPIKISMWTCDQAREAFLSRFEALVLQQSHLRYGVRHGTAVRHPV